MFVRFGIQYIILVLSKVSTIITMIKICFLRRDHNFAVNLSLIYVYSENIYIKLQKE